MSFWQPARMTENKQLELDRRVILGTALNEFKKQLKSVQKKMDKQTEEALKVDVFNLTKAQRVRRNVKADLLAEERRTIERRIDIIEVLLNSNDF